MTETALALVWQSVQRYPERPALRYLTAERSVGWLSYKQARAIAVLPGPHKEGVRKSETKEMQLLLKTALSKDSWGWKQRALGSEHQPFCMV